MLLIGYLEMLFHCRDFSLFKTISRVKNLVISCVNLISALQFVVSELLFWQCICKPFYEKIFYSFFLYVFFLPGVKLTVLSRVRDQLPLLLKILIQENDNASDPAELVGLSWSVRNTFDVSNYKDKHPSHSFFWTAFHTLSQEFFDLPALKYVQVKWQFIS